MFQGFWTEAFISSIRPKVWKDLDIVAGVGCVVELVSILRLLVKLGLQEAAFARFLIDGKRLITKVASIILTTR